MIKTVEGKTIPSFRVKHEKTLCLSANMTAGKWDGKNLPRNASSVKLKSFAQKREKNGERKNRQLKYDAYVAEDLTH